MKRKCNCSGVCGPQDDVSRREFIELLGAGAAGAVLAGQAWTAEPPEDLSQWKRSLLAPSPARLYRSGVHTDARMHLGGIGTGNIEIGVDGQLTNWQLFNTLRDGHVPLLLPGQGRQDGQAPSDAGRCRTGRESSRSR